MRSSTKRKQGHAGLAEKNKDDNSNLPLTEDKTACTLNSSLRFELPSAEKKIEALELASKNGYI
jgi:hypothetical protein